MNWRAPCPALCEYPLGSLGQAGRAQPGLMLQCLPTQPPSHPFPAVCQALCQALGSSGESQGHSYLQ